MLNVKVYPCEGGSGNIEEVFLNGLSIGLIDKEKTSGKYAAGWFAFGAFIYDRQGAIDHLVNRELSERKRIQENRKLIG
jgi:hypothetical protein